MRIDAHQHFWRYDAHRDSWITDEMRVIRRDFLPADLEATLSANGIGGCVAVQADQSDQETQFLLDLAHRHRFIKGVVGWVDLLSPRLEETLDTLSVDPLLRGVRQVAQAEADDFLERDDVIRGIGRVGRAGLTYDILIVARQLPAALALTARLPDQPFVLDHLAKPPIKNAVRSADRTVVRGSGRPAYALRASARSRRSPGEGGPDFGRPYVQWSQAIRELARRPNVFCKLSGLVTEADWQAWRPEDLRPYFDVAFEAFGVERLMFGSDWPVCLVAASYERVLESVVEYAAALSTSEREALFGGNAARFYGLAEEP